MKIVFDIESNGLLRDATKVHCISCHNIDTGESLRFIDIEEGLKYLDQASVLIGHNICTYDLPLLHKLYNWETSGLPFDTILAGNILYPEETLSLETWAYKLGLQQQKVQNEDWSVYTEAMGIRCDIDVQINLKVYEHLVNNKHIDMITEALMLEQMVALVHAQQTLNGVVLDQDKAWLLVDGFDRCMQKLRDKILKDAPWKCRIKGVNVGKQEQEKKDREYSLLTKGSVPCSPAFKKDKTYNAATKNYFGKDYKQVKGPYTKIDLIPVNLDSDGDLKELMLSLGWKPTEWNFVKDPDGSFRRTGPKLTEDSYPSLPPGIGQMIARYCIMKHRRGILLTKKGDSGALRKIRDDGKVSAEAFTCGTPTARYRHSGAVCNIPRITTPFGRAIRNVYGVPKDNWQIGIDLSGIEARMLAVYLLRLKLPNAQVTADLILSPDKTNDFHSYNAKVWGCSRDTAKTVLYA